MSRFRLPHARFVELSTQLEDSDCFSRWKEGTKDACRVQALLLCALCYLGHGKWTFDDLAQNSAISPDVIRVFYNCFIEYGSTLLYDVYVRPCCTTEESERRTAAFAETGNPNGSKAATNMALLYMDV
jgi:hypothetical protein